jgi:hypothetical protein
MTDTSGDVLAQPLCRPGSVIRIEGAIAVLCAFLRQGTDLFGVTVGHAFNNPNATVELLESGSAFLLGVGQDWLADGAHDVGIFKVTTRLICREDPEEDVVSIAPYAADRLAELEQAPCRIYFGNQRRDSGIISTTTAEARLLVTSPIGSIPGDSGSPSYVETSSGWSLVGQYLGRTEDGLTKRFQHPGPGLSRLGFSFGR